MASFLNQDFGGSESEDEDFNPAPEVASDEEDAANEPDEAQNQRRPSEAEPARRKIQEKSYDEDDDEDAQVDQAPASDEPNTQDSAVAGVDNAEDGVEDANGEADADADGDEADDRADAEGDEDEEDEDEEDDKDAVTGRPRKRHKRDARLQFIDVEAEVDDEEEEDEAEDDDLPDETHPDDLLDMPAGAENDDRRHRELDRQRELAASMDAEKQAAALREKYGRNRVAPVDSVVVPQRLLLPSVDDPTIWAIKVKPGKERDVVFSIMKRVEERTNSREPLAVISAFERGGTMSGYVYVEARKQIEVLTATDGISFAYPRTKMMLIPINEMPDLLRTTKSKELLPGMYVRIKRGTYAGDLAMIEEVETNGLEVTVRLVPRLHYGLNEDLNAPTEKRKRPGGLTGNPSGARPPQRLFSEAEARKKHGKFLSQSTSLGRKVFTYLNETYVDGFLIKDFKIPYLQTEDVNPTLEEVTKFAAGGEDGSDNLDLTQLAATFKATVNAASSYLPGDMVEIYEGEQRGVCGRAVAVHNDIVTLKVTEGDLKGQTIEAPINGLRKMFRDGDHVKVIGGSKYHDEVGMVVRVKDDRVTLLTDSNNQEITVFSKDLREASDSSGAPGMSKYDLYDLVQLDASTVACVIKADRESLRVLDQNGSVRTILPSNVSNKIERRRHAAATDRDGSEIRNDDTVKEYSGEQKQGRVLHIHRNYLFIQNRQQTENAGVFVVRSTNVTTVAAKGGRVNNAGPDLTKMNPALQRNGGANGNIAMPPPKSIGRDRLIGKTVTVRKGPYKGYLGIVKDTTDNDARVELHTKNKTITVPKDTLAVKDPITGASQDFSKFGAGRGRPGMGGSTPFSRVPAAWDGGRTPGWSGSRTPAPAMQGARTPAWSQAQAAQGNKTPGWNRWGDGSRTVNPYGDGSRTAYGGATSYGGATAYGGSAWGANATTPYNPAAGYSTSDAYSGSKTPAWGGSSSTAYGAGSRTPAYGAGSRTPAYSSANSTSYNHSTPGAYPNTANAGATPGASGGYDAPTPGFSAPSPADAANHPTPRPYGGAYATPTAAPTPGGYPDTPGPYGAPTPAAFGDEDPRYE